MSITFSFLLDLIAVQLFRKQVRGASRFHWMFCAGRRLPVKTKHGLTMFLDPYEYVDGYILRKGYYEEEVLLSILENLAEGGVFWDIGANLGIHTLTVAKLRSDVRVFAFEPQAPLSLLIEESARRNRITVKVLTIALSDRSGVGVLFVHPGNLGMSSLHNWSEDIDALRVETRVTTGDILLEDMTVAPPDVIKIDVEGHEIEVLRGMAKFLESTVKCCIVFEDSGDTSSTKKLLSDYGFVIESLPRIDLGQQHNLENFIAKRCVQAAGVEA